MTTINFGKINQYILFGGGRLMCWTVKFLKQKGLHVFVVTSQRHLTEIIAEEGVNTMTFKEYLDINKIKYVVSKDVSSDYRVINKIKKNVLGVSFGAAWIFKPEFINKFNGKLLNCHGSYLPRDRGGGGFSWRILRNDRSGISLIHKIDSNIDAGDIIFFEEYMYPSNCRCPIDFERYSTKHYQKLLFSFFKYVRNEKSFNCISQQEYFSTYWPRLLTDIHGYINWDWSLDDIEKFICAFDDPYKGASTFINGKKVRIKKCFSSANDGKFHPLQKGMIYRHHRDIIFVATEQGALLVNDVLDDNGDNIKESLHVGDRFYTPEKYIEKAKQYRAVYTPSGIKKVKIFTNYL